jgi:hypothetical protein
MLGYVKNFSWQLLSNGGFECTTSLISRGEIISSLKLSSNSKIVDFNKSVDVTTKPTMAQFEQIFLNYSALLNNSELSTQDYTNFGGGKKSQFGGSDDASLYSQITDQTVLDFVSNVQNTTTKYPLKKDDSSRSSYNLLNFFNADKFYSGGTIPVKNPDPGQYGFGIEYVRFDIIIALINLYFNLKDENGKIITHILIPFENQCLACTDSVSIDPTVCLIQNPKATNISGNPSGVIPAFVSKIIPENYAGIGSNSSSPTITIPDNIKDNFLVEGSNNRGLIKNIYVSLPKVIEIFRSKMNSDSNVLVVDFLKELLNQISRAVGGINNFQLHTTKSEIEIIDVKYLEQNPGTKFKFDLLGLKSICRDVKLTSRIFESQSTMIGIAAQSSQNVGDIYSSTQTAFNKGLVDRIVQEKTLDKGSSNAQTDTEKNFQALRGYVQRIANMVFDYGVRIPTQEEIANAASVYKTFLYQKQTSQLGQTAIIPLELEITLDGISGIIIGQVFQVDSSILPQSYNKAKVGFITTGVSHSLQNNDWITVIKAQICILD